jgi:hypothetical protein
VPKLVDASLQEGFGVPASNPGSLRRFCAARGEASNKTDINIIANKPCLIMIVFI